MRNSSLTLARQYTCYYLHSRWASSPLALVWGTTTACRVTFESPIVTTDSKDIYLPKISRWQSWKLVAERYQNIIIFVVVLHFGNPPPSYVSNIVSEMQYGGTHISEVQKMHLFHYIFSFLVERSSWDECDPQTRVLHCWEIADMMQASTIQYNLPNGLFL